ncbi:hypothetical protein BDR03DRAFT_839824, partial [Suillus americanus]
CVTGLTIRHVGERFQRSNETISNYFHKMLDILSSHPFYMQYIHLPADDAPVSSKICDNPKRWPYFMDTIGAIDGSHIHAFPRSYDHHLYQNRK